MKAGQKRILVVDNFDSFTFNLVHLLEHLDLPLNVWRNDEIDFHSLGDFSHILIGPGPGLPDESKAISALLKKEMQHKSILGICLGMQALLMESGAGLEQLPTLHHGSETTISVDSDANLFKRIPGQFRVGRYHSWGVRSENVPSAYKVTSTASDGFAMAVEHRTLDLFGIQFHPESIMTQHGLSIIENWINSDSKQPAIAMS